jgi:MFS family permease
MPAGLWSDRDFRLFWGGQAVSLTGSVLTRVATPLLAVLTLHASPVGLGVLEAAVWLPFLGLPLLAGAYVDRHRKRPILLGANAVRVVLVGSVPVLAWTGWLTLPILCGIALASGVCEVFFQIAELAFVPGLVGRDRLLAANSSVEAARAGAELGGTGLAGVIVQALGAPVAMAIDAGSYVVSTLSLAAIRRPEPPLGPPAPGRRVWQDIGEGLRYVWRSVPIRTIALQAFAFNGLWQAFNVPFVLYAIRERQIGTGWWGLVLAVSGGAALLGSLLAPKVAGRFGYGRAILVTGFVMATPMLLVPAVRGPVWVIVAVWAGALGLSGLANGVFNVLIVTLRARLTPDDLLGRVGASARLVVFAGMPIGGFGGGLLAAHLGNLTSLWLTSAIGVLSGLILIPVRGIGRNPGWNQGDA